MPDNDTVLTELRAKLADKKGRVFWRSLDELAQTDDFKMWIEDEFPNRADLLNIDRRQFLKVGGAALAMAGLTGCRILPQTKAVPYVRSPEELVSGLSLSYATALTRGGYATGVLVEQYEGRPIKVEGNPKHPASLGATDVWEQAEILQMYDPDRSQSIVHNGEIVSYNDFVDAVRAARPQWAKGGLHILTGNITSPTLDAQLTALLAKNPGAVWHAYEPLNRDNVYAGTNTAFGVPLNPVYNLKNARVIVSLDADIFKTLPGNVRYSRDWADGRRVRGENPGEMNRMYVIESDTTITGASADHRYPVKPSEIESVAVALYNGVTGGASSAQPVPWLNALVADMQANQGAVVVVPGEQASAATHAYAHAINDALGAVGKTVIYTKPVEASPTNHLQSLTYLVEAMNAGQVHTLVILGTNPVYDAPQDLNFADALKKVPFSAQLALYQDETSAQVTWHLAATHPFEMWGDARAFDGTTTLVQPLIAPLYAGNRSEYELAAELLDEPAAGHDIVMATYREQGGTNFEAWWEQALIAGVVPQSAAPAEPVNANRGAVSALPAPPAGAGLEILFRPDTNIYDGRYANNSWLQELPKPLTTIAWDNVAIVSPATAKKIGATPSDGTSDAMNAAKVSGKSVVALNVPGMSPTLSAADLKARGVKDGDIAGLRIPVWIQPGHPDDVITVQLGFGRTKVGKVGEDVGSNTYLLRSTQTMGYATGVTGTRVKLSVDVLGDPFQMIGDARVGSFVDQFGDYRVSHAQAQQLMRGIDIKETEDRDIVRHGTLAQFRKRKGDMSPEYGTEMVNGGESSRLGVEVPHSELPTDPGNDQTADRGFPVPGLQGREQWKYKDREPAERTITNPQGLVSLYPEFSKSDFNAWALSIDLSVCTGCSACTIACQAENNIPTVGKEQVGRGRAMHWIRIDHYFSSNAADEIGMKDPAQVESYFMPVACMHCEKAPCEPVCPVAATVHSHEGLNQMVYNRCVGTRYCSNNCPYKVRRFNFLKWTAGWGGKGTLNFFDLPVLKLLPNPDVTVRGRGVMEKCTYCVQRINNVRVKAKKEQREIQDGEIVMACQQVCPTNAIVFGDINNPKSEVSKLKRQPHDYGLLAELNTRPRTTYLARVKNPNPAIAPLKSGDKEKAA